MSDVNKSGKHAQITRRRFVKDTGRVAAAGLAFPTIVASSAIGLGQAPPPSRRITVACIGVGDRGVENLKSLLAQPDVRVVAVCDVDAKHSQEAKLLVDQAYAGSGAAVRGGCPVYGDFRAILEKQDIDAVAIATPDHWHGIIAVQSARAGKDIYCETPLSLTIAEGRAICQMARRYDRIFQTGSQRRSDPRFRFACELVKN